MSSRLSLDYFCHLKSLEELLSCLQDRSTTVASEPIVQQRLEVLLLVIQCGLRA